jgi:uncharacterized protein YyaL (SSP411 family)
MRIIAIQTVMRCPVNIRPLILTRKTYNPKGVALFSQGLLDCYRVTGDETYLSESKHLLDWLLTIHSKGSWHGFAWGYQYPWQDPGFYAKSGMPNAVVTSFVCEAFLDAWRVTGDQQYLDLVGKVIPFFLNDLTVLKNTDDELCLAYMPLPMTMRVMDVSILIGAVIAQYAAITGQDNLIMTGERLARYVVNQQTDYYAWYYTDPSGDSHITHDNYHTGFILDALWRYMSATGDRQWENQYWKGLEFYAENHFNKNGAPRWMYDVEYPHDIHGAAQGILTFSRHTSDYPGLAMKIADWAIENMYHPDGRFFYQETRFYKKQFTLMRWCNAWMVRALSRLFLELNKT